jgi:hypothetical protein
LATGSDGYVQMAADHWSLLERAKAAVASKARPRTHN